MLSYEAIVKHINNLAGDVVGKNKNLTYDFSLVCTRLSVLTLVSGSLLSSGHGFYFLGRNGHVYYADNMPKHLDNTIVLVHVYPLDFVARNMSNDFKKTKRRGEPVIPKLTYADLQKVQAELEELNLD